MNKVPLGKKKIKLLLLTAVFLIFLSSLIFFFKAFVIILTVGPGCGFGA